MQNDTGHSGIDRKKRILAMHGQSNARDKTKNRANPGQKNSRRNEIDR